jgi:hypothetical protein
MECGGGVCDGSGSCADGGPIWSQSFGGTDGADEGDFARDVAVDSADNIFVVGRYWTDLSFGAGTFNAIDADPFITKLAADGSTPLWTLAPQSDLSDDIPAVAVDANDDVFVAGHYRKDLTLDGIDLTNPAASDELNVLIAKLDGASGDAAWASGYGDGGRQTALAVATDGSNVVVGGYNGGTINFGGSGDELVTQGARDGYIVKLDESGGHVWSMGFGDAERQEVHSVVVDGQGAIYAAGIFHGVVSVGSTLTAVDGSRDIFVVKLDGDGNVLWARGFGGSLNETSPHLALTPDGGVVLVGGFRGEIQLGANITLSSEGSADGFIAKLDEAGSVAWAERLGSAGGFEACVDVTVDASGNITALLRSEDGGGFDFGEGVEGSPGGIDVGAVKLSADGQILWGRIWGDTAGNDEGQGIAVTSTGELLLLGYYDETITFDQTHTSALDAGGNSEADIFLAKLAP